MPTTTARTLIMGAFEVIQVFQSGETPGASEMEGALGRLNRMISSWAVQPLTIPVIAREVFPITSDLGVYTIGPGGDFDTTRPSKLTGAGLLLNNDLSPVSLTSITRSGSTATATKASHGFADGQYVTIAGASLEAYNGTFPITVPTVNTFTYLVEGQPLSPASGTLTAFAVSSATDVTEIPRAVITDDAWQRIQIKTLTSALFTYVYYNPTFAAGLGTINLWPIPTTDEHALVLYRPQQLSEFASLSAEYILPDGYGEAIEYQLARRLTTPFGVSLSPEAQQLAAESFAWLKRTNVKMNDLDIDPMFTMNRRGGYDIYSGGYVGGVSS